MAVRTSARLVADLVDAPITDAGKLLLLLWRLEEFDVVVVVDSREFFLDLMVAVSAEISKGSIFISLVNQKQNRRIRVCKCKHN